jgi:outer membrane lipoprotein carrier protein
MNRPILTAAFMALSVSVLSGRQGVPPAPDVAAAVQRKYETVRDFSAEFTQQRLGGPLRRKIVEQGTVRVKKPGKMRWEYEAPDEKVFVSDGRRLYFHDPANNQVTISEIPRGDRPASAAQFLAGRGSLTRDFDVSFADGAAPDTYALKLVPRSPQDDYAWLELVVDRNTYQIRSLTAVEQGGTRSTFLFSDFRENIGISDKAFQFEIPRGVEVIHAGPPKR